MESIQKHRIGCASDSLRDMMELIRPNFESVGGELETSIPDDLYCEANPREIGELIVDLINETLFLLEEEGTTEKYVSLCVEEEENNITIEIKYHGPEMDESSVDLLRDDHIDLLRDNHAELRFEVCEIDAVPKFILVLPAVSIPVKNSNKPIGVS